MSNAETPAEQTGGNTATPARAPLSSIPPRIRVHALAKLLGTTSRELLDKLSAEGFDARSPQSTVSRGVALRLAESYGVADSGTDDAGERVGGNGEEASKQRSESGAPAPKAEEPGRAGAQAPAVAAAGQEPTVPPAVPGASGQLFSAPQVAQPEPAPQPAFSAPPPAASPQPLFAPPAPVFVQPDEAEPIPVSKTVEEDAEPAGEPPREDEGRGDEEQGTRRRRRRGRRGRGRGKGGESSAESSEQEQAAAEAGVPDGKPEPDGQGEAGAEPAPEDGGKDKAGDKAADGGAASNGGDDAEAERADETTAADKGEAAEANGTEVEGSTRRRRRRRRRRSADNGEAAGSADSTADEQATRSDDDQVRSVRGSTRLEAKRQRRRDGREAGRRRAPILSEAEFLARRESVERTMVVRERVGNGERTTQIGVLEDGVLVEHFVTSSGQGSIVGNVYLGRVQNVLPSMEAAFVDIGRGRNAVLYAGEVDWDAAGLEGKSRKIEQALSPGDQVLVQVTKDPVGHKGARLTTQISLPGRYLVYVPGGGTTGISRKLPENERRRLKEILKRIVPDDAGVIIRTASEGISEEELARDINRLRAQWETICEKAGRTPSGGKKAKKNAPALLYEEPDLLVKVVRDLFTEDFSKMIIQGSVAWETINSYVQNVAPDLADRLERYTGNGDVFHDYRIDEQIAKALDRKVWLPSGGYLVIDRTEAMTVIDVNTGKFTGSGGNLEETVTRNNLESAEEIVRQLRLRDIGGIIVIDFIDMVLESNRELVLRRLTECLARDRTRHQVAEVTSLGLVQMTRKKIGTGLLEAYSTPCEHCKGRGVIVGTEPRLPQSGSDGNGKGRKRGKQDNAVVPEPTPQQRESVVSAVAAIASATAKPKQSGSVEASGSGKSEAAGSRQEKDAKPARAKAGPSAGAAERGKGKSDPLERGEDRSAKAGEGVSGSPARDKVGPERDGGKGAATDDVGKAESDVAAVPSGARSREDASAPQQPADEKPAPKAAEQPAQPIAGQTEAASSNAAVERREPEPAPEQNAKPVTALQTPAVRQASRPVRVSRPAGPPESRPDPVETVQTAPAGSPSASEVLTPVARQAPRRAKGAASRPAGPPPATTT
ncbi:translation initiation factor IF-2 N-terminal domain-containing protein [Thermocrispum agreste]|uniref:translation initiation factor IF-2 N-terminal domain-containing protein n=1 Tax=Thermocrispum agreste TaxID=37925 RepID=UPI000414C680|nr:translation initiation factor IF-2 N-terminal domain-containing protein [Thermocrispum agreste]